MPSFLGLSVVGFDAGPSQAPVRYVSGMINFSDGTSLCAASVLPVGVIV